MRIRSGLPQPTSQVFAFTSHNGIGTLARLLGTHRGHHSCQGRFYALLYSLLIYDHYAQAFAITKKPATNVGLRAAWIAFAKEPDVARIYKDLLYSYDESQPIGDISFDLPIQSTSPLFSRPSRNSFAAGTYRVRKLGSIEFIEAAWQVRCNLLHGSCDPNDAKTWKVLRNISRVMSALVWQLILGTPQ